MIDEEFGVASIIMRTPDVCCIFVALYPVTSVTLQGVELFGLNLVSFHYMQGHGYRRGTSFRTIVSFGHGLPSSIQR